MSDHRACGQADGPIDQVDRRVLESLAACWQHADPVPVGLADTMAEAVRHHELEVEVASVLAPFRPIVGRTRSDDDVRALTFTTARTTIMVQVTRTGVGRRRLDGWVEPASCQSVRLFIGGRENRTSVSGTGRFAFADLSPATMRLQFLDEDDVPVTVTPAFEW